MKQQKTQTRQTRTPALGIPSVALGLALIGASCLAWISLREGAAFGCGPGSSCDRVLHSRWAYWLGIPVSLPAVVSYALLLLGTWLVTHNPRSPRVQLHAWAGIVSVAVLILAAALWFVGLQIFVIKAYCKFCLATHAAAAAAAAFLLAKVPRTSGGKADSLASGLAPRQIGLFVAAGLSATAILPAGQLLVQHRGYEAVSASTAAAVAKPAVERARVFELYDGRVALALNELPTIGSPQASNVVVNLFDYTCHHCRAMHQFMRPVVAQLSNSVLVVTLPTPLDKQCNPIVPRTPKAHTNACEYARLGLAVWLADRAKSAQYDEWFFAQPDTPALGAARDRAMQLIGAENLSRATASPWITSQLQINVSLYSENFQATRKGTMPQLMIGSTIIFGPVRSVQEFRQLLERHLGPGAPRRL